MRVTYTQNDCVIENEYRYILTRKWWSDLPVAMVIGLNPSTANSEKDDPTIRTLVKFLNHLGYGGLQMMNLYALISSKPKALREHHDPVGKNDAWLMTTAYGVQEIIFAWGNFKNIDYRVKKVVDMFPDGKCFGRNANGTPWHPLSLMYKGIKLDDVSLTKFKLKADVCG